MRKKRFSDKSARSAIICVKLRGSLVFAFAPRYSSSKLGPICQEIETCLLSITLLRGGMDVSMCMGKRERRAGNNVDRQGATRVQSGDPYRMRNVADCTCKHTPFFFLVLSFLSGKTPLRQSKAFHYQYVVLITSNHHRSMGRSVPPVIQKVNDVNETSKKANGRNGKGREGPTWPPARIPINAKNYYSRPRRNLRAEENVGLGVHGHTGVLNAERRN